MKRRKSVREAEETVGERDKRDVSITVKVIYSNVFLNVRYFYQ